MALCYGPRCSFRFQKHCYVAVKPKLSHLFSTIQQAKRIKTIHEIPGHRNYFPSFRAVLQLLHTKLTRRNKPDRKLYLEKQFKEVEKFGPIYKVELPGLRAINLVDPTEVAKILRSEPKYPTRFDLPILKYYRNTRKALPGIFFADGEDWYRYRSMARKRILRPQDVAEHVPVFNDIITDFMTRLDAIRGPAGSDAEHEVKDIDNELFKWSFESVAHVLFDKRFGCLDNEVNLEAQGFIKSIGIFISTATKLNFLPVWVYNFYKTDTFKEFVFHYDNMYKYADLIIKRKVQELEQKEKLDLQMPAQNLGHTTPEKVGFVEYLLSNEKLSRDDLFASIIDLLFAGVDTTSNTMQWFLYMMAKNQDKQEKLFQEVSMVLQPGEVPSAQSLAKMTYLKACLRETLRLYPVLSITGRVIHADMEILGYHLPKGTYVQFLNYYMSRDEKYFKEPNKFIPERWLRSEKREVSDSVQAFASIPFGFGARMCVGRRLAEMELYLLATRLICKYKLHYPDNEELKPYFRSTTAPDSPLRVKFVERATECQ